MKVAIIGLPMSGKTSLFHLLTGVGEETGGRGRTSMRQTRVMDPRLDRLATDYSPKKITPAVIDFLDFPPIAKVEGAERKSCADLLAPAREAGAMLIVARAFENPAVPPLRGEVNAGAEVEELLDELRLADLEIATNRRDRVQSSIPKKRGDEQKALEEELAILEQVVPKLEEGGDVRDLELSPDQRKRLRGFQFFSGKPYLIVENVTDGRGKASVPGAIPLPVAIELELEELDDETREMFREEYGITESARDRVVAEIYTRAGLISFLTAGEPEVRAWTVPEGSSAVEAADAIHSDIARGFIRAEVLAYDDYITDGGHAGARDKGHLRLEGKEYVMQDGDIVLFRFSV